MNRVGVLTFHYALNCGSVLQAQATQIIVERMGYDCEIIDYDYINDEQYDEIYTHRNCKGKACFNLLFYSLQNRKRRINNFQSYRNENLRISSRKYHTLSELEECSEEYDVYVSGSDQIWSDAVPEIRAIDVNLTKGYYLSFTKKPKIAYASCVSTMKENELEKYKSLLCDYTYLSTREKIGAERLSKVTGRNVSIVLDPSFLLNRRDWLHYSASGRIVEEKYVLLYSLRNFHAQINWIRSLIEFSKRNKLRIVVLAPYFSLPMPGVINMLDSGPDAFLNLIMNAELVVTDSFHGTAFAINFNVPLYSLGNKYWKDDTRKIELLTKLDMQSRIINDESEICSVKEYSYNYVFANKTINELREQSLDYLARAIIQCLS